MAWLYLEEMELLFYSFNEEKIHSIDGLEVQNCELVLTFVLFSVIVLHTIKSNNAINFNFKHLKP